MTGGRHLIEYTAAQDYNDYVNYFRFAWARGAVLSEVWRNADGARVFLKKEVTSLEKKEKLIDYILQCDASYVLSHMPALQAAGWYVRPGRRERWGESGAEIL